MRSTVVCQWHCLIAAAADEHSSTLCSQLVLLRHDAGRAVQGYAAELQDAEFDTSVVSSALAEARQEIRSLRQRCTAQVSAVDLARDELHNAQAMHRVAVDRSSAIISFRFSGMLLIRRPSLAICVSWWDRFGQQFRNHSPDGDLHPRASLRHPRA